MLRRKRTILSSLQLRETGFGVRQLVTALGSLSPCSHRMSCGLVSTDCSAAGAVRAGSKGLKEPKAVASCRTPKESMDGTCRTTHLLVNSPTSTGCGGGRRPTRACSLGPGDDTAVLRLRRRGRCLVTTDMLLDGSCFRACRGRAAAGRPQGDGRQPQRHRGDGRPAGGGGRQRRPAAARRPGAGRGAVPGPARGGRRLRHGHRRRRHEQLGRPAGHLRDAARRGDGARAGAGAAAPGRATGCW